jgi:hypothetical protein
MLDLTVPCIRNGSWVDIPFIFSDDDSDWNSDGSMVGGGMCPLLMLVRRDDFPDDIGPVMTTKHDGDDNGGDDDDDVRGMWR